MRADAVVRARIDRETKDHATRALRDMGLSVSDAIRLLLRRVADEKRLPFAIQVPNAATVQAMNELDEGRGQRFENAEELFREACPDTGTPTSGMAPPGRERQAR